MSALSLARLGLLALVVASCGSPGPRGARAAAPAPAPTPARYERLTEEDFDDLGDFIQHERHGDLLYDVALSRITSGGLSLAVPADRPDLLEEFDEVREAFAHAEARSGIVLRPVDIEVRYTLLGGGALGVFLPAPDVRGEPAPRHGLVAVQLHLLAGPRFPVLVHEFAHALLEARRPEAPHLVHEGFANFVESSPSLGRTCRDVAGFQSGLWRPADDVLAAVPFVAAYRAGGRAAALALAADPDTTDERLTALVRDTCEAQPARAGLRSAP